MEQVAAEWISVGHLFLALERTGTSAKWLLDTIGEFPEAFEIFESARAKVQVANAIPPNCATDMEVALLFHFWPEMPLPQAIAAVGRFWRTTRVLTLKSFIARQKLDGENGPIAKACEDLREGRSILIADVYDSLALVDPLAAAKVTAVANRGRYREEVDVALTPVPDLKSLMAGIT